MRIVVLAPIRNSLYSCLVTHLLAQAPGIDVCRIVVRTPWSFRRIRGELRRDGIRLLRKVYRKLVVGDSAYAQTEENIVELSVKVGLPRRDLYRLGRYCRIPVSTVRDHNETLSCDAITKAQPDLIVFTGGGLIRDRLLQIPRLGVLNCHMGPLPRYRGMDVVEWPILEHGSATANLGLTVHFMDKGVDTGDVLAQRETVFHDLDTFRRVRDRMEPQMVRLMVETVIGLRDGTVNRTKQRVDSGRQYFVMHPRLYEIAERCLRSAVRS